LWHKKKRIKLPNVRAHAVFHAIVENQIAMGLEPTVRAISRLTNEGLSRHEALHAVAGIVAEYLYEASKTNDKDFTDTMQARYNAAVERLTGKQWLQDY